MKIVFGIGVGILLGIFVGYIAGRDNRYLDTDDIFVFQSMDELTEFAERGLYSCTTDSECVKFHIGCGQGIAINKSYTDYMTDKRRLENELYYTQCPQWIQKPDLSIPYCNLGRCDLKK